MTVELEDRDAKTDLRGFIHEHRVCWETTLHREAHHGELRTVGYDVVLMAQCPGEGPWDPADRRSGEIFGRLAELAQQVLPQGVGIAAHIEGFEPAFHLRREIHWVPEIRLVIEVRHGTDYFALPDDTEHDSLRRLEAALTEWGVAQGTWGAEDLRKTGASA